ncbi:MAG: thiamine pyrophosphate-binding protein [Rhodoblastus sp.]
MSQTVSELLVGVLEQVGVKQIFGLIGDSLNPLADAVRRSSIEWVGVRHEEGAALAASGQAKLTGGLGVCAGTTGPGSTHLVAGLYEAARDHAPVLALSGDMPRALQGTDYIQTTNPDLLFRDVCVYTQTLMSAAQAAPVVHQAIAAAFAAPGPAHLTLPQDVLSLKTDHAAYSIPTLRPRPEFIASEEDIVAAARMIDEAGSIVVMCGAGCRGATDLLREFSDRLKAPLIHSVRGKELMPYDEPRWMGGIGMIGTKPVYRAVQDCDLFIMLGTDYPYPEFLPKDAKTIQVDVRPQVLGRRTGTKLGILGSVVPTVRRLLERIAEKSDRVFFDRLAAGRRDWDAMLDKQADLSRSADIIHPMAVARCVSNHARKDAIFVFDTGLNTLWSANWIRQSGEQRIVGSFNNAAVGTSLGQANGIQALDRSKQVIALTGDGGFNMLMGEFMTAVHHRLPVKVIVYDNSALGLITLEAESIGLVPFKEAIEFPNPDFAALARACGGHGFTAKKPDELEGAIAGALAVDGPAIVDAVVAADEMPNMPHVDLEKAKGYALAKIKESLHRVIGS